MDKEENEIFYVLTTCCIDLNPFSNEPWRKFNRNYLQM